ncbi:MAG TPA: DUF4129 domain-containing protein [Jatrophihabitans sp.]|nr:DUF4129 domain-containing protein [Jatrophihabitans sp.]
MRATARIRARDGGLVALAAAGVFAVAVAAHAHSVATNQSLRSSVGVPLTPKTRVGSEQDGTGKSHPFHFNTHLHLPGWLISGLIQLAFGAAVVLLVVLLVKLVPQIRRRIRPPEPLPDSGFAPSDSTRRSEQATSTVERALAGLRRGDSEQAIIACWLQLQDIVASAGYPPAASQTSSELVQRWQQVLPFSRAALSELAELYREARFSSHRMSVESLQRARSALRRLRDDLRAGLPGIITDG